MRLSSLARLYRVRLRTRRVQELFAVVGIAVGVALLFAAQVASTSLDGSVQQLTSGLVGRMQFQLTARGPQGFPVSLLGEVQRIPGVLAAAPVLEERANAVGPSGQESVDLIGTDPRFADLGGPLLRHFHATQLARLKAFALPMPIAQAIGVYSLQTVRLEIGARTVPGFLGTELLESEIGALVHSPVAIAPLAYAQQLTGMGGRITRIFVQAQPGREREARAGLVRLAGDRLNVSSADFEATLFRAAAAPTNQSAVLFSAISALVGFLFAINAMLLTVPQRRALIEDLRLDGYTRPMIVKVLLFDALVLGVVASLVGLALGEALSLALFHANPGYLSFGFPVGSQRIVTWRSIVLAVAGGLVAACIGVLWPLRGEILSRLTFIRATSRHSFGRTMLGPAAGLLCLAVTTIVLLLAPAAAIFGIVCLLAALVLLLPVLLEGTIAVFGRVRSVLGVSAYLAVIELRSRFNRTRSLAIAATGAIAVFGSVAIQGAHDDLQRGLDNSAHDVTSVADVWVAPPGVQNLLATTLFPGTAVRTLERLPGVRAVRLYRSTFVDYGVRRVWVLAPPRASQLVPPSQLVSGDVALATARLRAGGWAVVSQAIADAQHLRVGQSFTLPSPRPTVFRVAALSTNIGWPPGAIVINADDFAHAWGSADPSAYNIMLAPGASAEQVRLEVRRALGAESGLAVETAGQREQRQRVASRQGLSRLTQISWLVLIAAVLAMAAAMGAMIWQRRARLADMKVDGFTGGVLAGALVLESAVLLGTGCLIGAIFGIFGQLLLSHALATVTGFPVVFSAGAAVAVVSFAIVTTVAVLIVVVPGIFAARVRPAISLQD